MHMLGFISMCVNVSIPTCPISPTTLPVPSILGLLHSAPAKSVRAAAVWASGSGSPRFIPRTAAGPPTAFPRGPAAVSISLSRSIIPRLTGSIIDATSVDINIGRQKVTSQKSVFAFPAWSVHGSMFTMDVAFPQSVHRYFWTDFHQ